MDNRQLLDEFNGVWAQMKTAMDDTRAASAEGKAQIKALNSRLDQIETSLRRPPLAGLRETGASDGYAHAPDPEVKAWLKAVAVGGAERLHDPIERARAERVMRSVETKMLAGPQEEKALSLGDDSAGGFLAPSEFSAEIVKGIQLISPIRQFARVRPTAYRSVDIPVRSGVFAAAWVGETATRSETSGLSFSMETITPNEQYAYVIVSQQDLEDSQLDLAQEIADEAAEQFAVAEGKAFISGSAIRQPEGIMTNAAVAHVASGDANLVKADSLINLMYSLKEGYARNAVWILNRKSVGAIRLLKNTNDLYIWAPDYSANNPATILGRPYAECGDMDDIAASKFPVAFGDLSRGYQIVDRVSMSVQRLNEKLAEQGQVVFLVRRRVGGQVILPEAIKKLEIAAS